VSEADVTRGLRIVCDNQAEAIADLRRRLAKAEASADYWREAWETAIYAIGDMMRGVEAGQVVTAHDLAGLLTRQEDEPT
jgi:hypothetical protein